MNATKTGKRPYLVGLIATVAAVGGFLFGYDLSIISGAMLFVKPEFGLTPGQVGMAIGSALLGWMLASNAVPVPIFVFGLMFVPESPRWMAQKSRAQEALDVLTAIDGRENAAREMRDILAASDDGAEWGELLRPGMRFAMLIACSLAVFQQITGASILTMYMPTVFQEAGYDAVELQIADPAQFDEDRVRQSLQNAGLPMCAFQTGSTYHSRGNCLCTANQAVRQRTVELLKTFVDLASAWNAVIVFGSLQGRLSDEPDREAGETRIREAVRTVGEYAAERRATIAFEPVNHLEVGFHNTISDVAGLVRTLALPSVRMMINTFHMNIEERDMLAPLAVVRGIMAHVHLSETNRDVLGTGHWPTAVFLDALAGTGYQGYCSVGVYNTHAAAGENARKRAWHNSSGRGHADA